MSWKIRNYIPPILWIILISALSTSSFSEKVTITYLERFLGLLLTNGHYDHVMLLSYLTRKTAHVVVYAVLAALWFRAFLKSDGSNYRKAIVLTVLVSLICAAADEYHQSFLSDRTAKLSDVVLDLAAASLSLSLINIGIKKRRLRAASKPIL